MKLLGLLPIAISLAAFALGTVLVFAKDYNGDAGDVAEHRVTQVEAALIAGSTDFWVSTDGETEFEAQWFGEHIPDSIPQQYWGFMPPFDSFPQIDSILGGELRYVDDDGEAHILHVDIGEVVDQSDDSLTIRLADDSEKEFDISDANVLGSFGEGDRGVVITIDGDVVAGLSGASPRSCETCPFGWGDPCPSPYELCGSTWLPIPGDIFPSTWCEGEGADTHRGGWFGYDPCITPAPSD
jgi:hypothetical protein